MDICQLEKTCFAEGIDIEVFWGELLQRHVARYDKETVHRCGHINFLHQLKQQIHHNRELLLSFIAAVVLKDARPSGYYLLAKKNRTLVDHYCRTCRPQDARQPHDIVNYLACCCAEELIRPLEEDEVHNTPISSYSSSYMPLTCYRARVAHATWHSLATYQLPSTAYTETCKSRQLVPPRYQHYFPSGSHRLSDLDALQLVADCHPLEIFLYPFENMPWGELSGVLSKLLASVESVNLYCCSTDRVALALLAALFMKERPALSVLHISRLDKTMMKSLAPLVSAQPISASPASVWGSPPNISGLKAPYCSLTELKLQFTYPSLASSKGHSVTNIQLQDDTANALASIIEHQTKLEMLTVANLGRCPEGACPRFCAALQSLCRKPLFRSLSLSGATLPFEGAKGVLQSFLSSQCTSHQSLVFRAVKLSHGSKYMSTDVPPNVTVDMPDCAQEHKSLTLLLTFDLTVWLLHQKEVKLKSLTVKPDSDLRLPHLLTLMANHPCFHVHELSTPYHKTDFTGYVPLLENPSLQMLEIECNSISAIPGLLKQAIEAKPGSLQKMKLRIPQFRPVLFSALFSLPQLHNINVSLSGFTHISLVERMYEAWKEISCECLPNLTVDLSALGLRTVDDIHKAMLAEMCIQYV